MHESNTFIKKTTPVENFMNPHYGDFITGSDIVDFFKERNISKRTIYNYCLEKKNEN